MNDGGEGKAAGARVAVVGCGHVGVVTAAGLAELGHQVVGIDRNESLVSALCAGHVEIHEPGLAELVKHGLDNGRLTFTTSYSVAIPDSDFVFLAVDTPATQGGAADLRNIRSATASIATAVNDVTPVIVNKSTSPIGTAETIEGILARALADRQRPPRIVSNPEFLRQGHAVHDFFHPERIVIGGHPDDTRAVAELYGELGGTLILTNVRTAEMIKYVANAFLATRVSFINEIARLCENVGVDVDEVVSGIALDPRIGAHFFSAGIGFGGSCLPKDVAALRYVGETMGVATPILSAVQEVNAAQRTSAVRRLRARLGTLDNKVIAVWGVTFKGGTEDARESPAIDVINLLINEGAIVRPYDPAFPVSAPAAIRMLYCSSALEAVRDADALAILTDWPEFRDVPLVEVRAAMRGTVIFDGRNLLSRAEVNELSFAYLGVGRPTTGSRRRRTDR
ncbi:MAG: UDP-glucose/GDP-mannose dehydrogenase family protein [Chloroflexota bacterium]|nr:UDP-glucose/GDP-mannose dehydrogenase family protein [Chloroflexota bacterium]